MLPRGGESVKQISPYFWIFLKIFAICPNPYFKPKIAGIITKNELPKTQKSRQAALCGGAQGRFANN
jgi:hypothetical protein